MDRKQGSTIVLKTLGLDTLLTMLIMVSVYSSGISLMRRVLTLSVGQLEAFQELSLPGLLLYHICDRVSQLSSLCVAAFGPVVACPRLTKTKDV